jgi:hypothetical protein
MTFEDLKIKISNICLLLGDHTIFKAIVSIRAFEILEEKTSQLTTPSDDEFYSLFDATPDIFLSTIQQLSEEFSSQSSLTTSLESDFLNGKVRLKSSADGTIEELVYENNGCQVTLAQLCQYLDDEPFIKITGDGGAFAESFGDESARGQIRPPFSYGRRVYLGDRHAHSVFADIAKSMCVVNLKTSDQAS